MARMNPSRTLCIVATVTISATASFAGRPLVLDAAIGAGLTRAAPDVLVRAGFTRDF